MVNVNRQLKVVVPVHAPGYIVNGLRVVCTSFPTMDMMRYERDVRSRTGFPLYTTQVVELELKNESMDHE